MNTDCKILATHIEALSNFKVEDIRQYKKIENRTIGYGSSEIDMDIEIVYGNIILRQYHDNGTFSVFIKYEVGCHNHLLYFAKPITCDVEMNNHKISLEVKNFSTNFQINLYELINTHHIKDDATSIGTS